MPSVEEQIEIPVPPEEVWATVRDFGAIDEYVPAVVSARISGEGVGARRTLILDGSRAITERLDRLDDSSRTLSYSVVEGPLPVKDYSAVLSVKAAGESTSEVRWSATFKVVGAKEMEMASLLSDLYVAVLNGLKDRHAPASS